MESPLEERWDTQTASPLSVHNSLTKEASTKVGKKKSAKILMILKDQVWASYINLELLGTPEPKESHSHLQVLCHWPSPWAHGEDWCKKEDRNKCPRWQGVQVGISWPCSVGMTPYPHPRPSYRGSSSIKLLELGKEMFLNPESCTNTYQKFATTWDRARNSQLRSNIDALCRVWFPQG